MGDPVAYGDLVIVEDDGGLDLLDVSRRLVLDQAMRTLAELNPLGVRSFKMIESHSDIMCETEFVDPEFGPVSAHSNKPHWHVGWKASLVMR